MRYPTRSGTALVALLAAALLAGTAFAPGPPSSRDGRDLLDGRLRLAADRGTVRRFAPTPAGTLAPAPGSTRTSATGSLTKTAPTTVTLFLSGTPDEAALARLGARRQTRVGGVLTAELPLSAVSRLGEVAGLTRATLARPVFPQLDVSVPAVNADTLRQRDGDLWSGRTGEGVIIGVVDSGLDVGQADFRRPDGSTRVLCYWDQADEGGPPPVSAEGDTLYGTEWLAADIDAGIVRATDRVGHGTHVAGIAAGNGRASDTDSLRYRHVGIAPEADLIIVDAVFLDTHILDAAAYIFAKAEDLGRPAVVNFSLGNQFGPHDGTTPLDRGLAELVGPGRLIVAAAGNEGLDRIHAELHVPAGGSDSATVEVPAYTPDAEFNFFTMDAFYHGPDAFAVTLVTPGGQRLGPYALTDEQSDTLTGEGSVFLLHWDPDPQGTNLEVQIEVSDFNPAQPEEQGPSPVAGLWRVVFSDLNSTPAGGEVDLWLPFAFPLRPQWTADRYDPSEEITTPGTAMGVVTVGAYNTKECWPSVTGDPMCANAPPGQDAGVVAPGPISYFSNHGPTRDGRRKPEVAAPGFLVSSSYSSQIDPALLLSFPIHTILNPDRQHWVNAGTSMATAHVAGALALWLENHPDAEPDSVLARLAISARTDAFTGEEWDSRAGHGKLDVAAFVDPDLVPVRSRSVAVSSVDGRPRLRWTARDVVSGFVLESRMPASEWVEREVFAGPGPHEWTDDLARGPVDYRLTARLRAGGRELWAEASWSPGPRPPRLILGPARPNPFRDTARMPFHLEGSPPAGWVSARVLDVRGRLVRVLGETWMDGDGAGVVEWDGSDAAGRRAGAGLYWIQLRSGDLSATVKLIRLP